MNHPNPAPKRPAEAAATTPSPERLFTRHVSPSLIADCEMMLRFVLDEGRELGEALQGQIAALDRWLNSNGQPTLSGLPSGLILNPSAGGESKSPTPAPDPIALLFKVHDQLGRLVSPATPFSLRATDTKRTGLGRIRDLPIVIRMAIAAAAVCMLGFFVTLCQPTSGDASKSAAAESSSYSAAPPSSYNLQPRVESKSAATDSSPYSAAPRSSYSVAPPSSYDLQSRARYSAADSSPYNTAPRSKTATSEEQMGWSALLGALGAKSFWSAVFGAGLGAAFYILIKTQKYLVNRSFDPKYNNVYLARFATGVVSGYILFIFVQSYPLKGPLAELGPGMIAILGGFSAEAVEQILRRMVEVLVTFVRGDGSAQAKAELATKQTKRDSAVRDKLAELKADPAKLTQTVADIYSLLK